MLFGFRTFSLAVVEWFRYLKMSAIRKWDLGLNNLYKQNIRHSKIMEIKSKNQNTFKVESSTIA